MGYIFDEAIDSVNVLEPSLGISFDFAHCIPSLDQGAGVDEVGADGNGEESRGRERRFHFNDISLMKLSGNLSMEEKEQDTYLEAE